MGAMDKLHTIKEIKNAGKGEGEREGEKRREIEERGEAMEDKRREELCVL
jgi:hypothetical protein